MKVKFNGDVEVKPMEWLYIALIATVLVLLVSGKTDEAIQILKDFLKLMKK